MSLDDFEPSIARAAKAMAAPRSPLEGLADEFCEAMKDNVDPPLQAAYARNEELERRLAALEASK